MPDRVKFRRLLGNLTAIENYLFKDEFTTELSTGSVNGTAAEPGTGTRTVRDVESKLSLAGGMCVLAAQATPLYPDEDIVYQNASQARVYGRLLVAKFNYGGSGNFFPAAFVNSTTPAWNAFTNVTAGFYVNSSTISAVAMLSANTVVASLSGSTDYTLAVLLRATGGAYFFIKGGSYTKWTLLYVHTNSNATPLYPALSGYTSVANIDYLRVPQSLMSVTPLAYDTFTRSNGALGDTETLGPDSQGLSARTWTGSTWTISTNKAINTPNVGSDLIVNGGFAADTDWTKGGGWTIGSGVASCDGSSNDITQAVNPLTGNTWYKTALTVSRTAGVLYVRLNTSIHCYNIATSATHTVTGLSSGAGFSIRSNGFNGTIDNVSCKALTLSELISSITSVGTANALVGADLTWDSTKGYQVGLIARLDNATTPGTFLLAMLSYGIGTVVVQLYKYVSGVYTSLIATNVTYSAGAKMFLICDGNSVSVYYNNSQVGTTQTVSDGATNTLFGIFSTEPTATIDNFQVFSRGSADEYSTLDKYITASPSAITIPSQGLIFSAARNSANLDVIE